MDYLNNCHQSWALFIENNRKLIDNILMSIDLNNIAPSKQNVFKIFEQDLHNISVVITGQDPYPSLLHMDSKKSIEETAKENHLSIVQATELRNANIIATGKSFQVNGLTDWSQKFRQTSFRNILRLLYKTYNGIENYEDIPKFKEITPLIASGEFEIKQPFELMDSWWQQGVLLLNASLTCEIGKPLSHEDLWAPFTAYLVNYISNENKDVCWFLWGKPAQKIAEHITHGKIYASRHPMMCSPKYEDDFLKAECFKETMDKINWL